MAVSLMRLWREPCPINGKVTLTFDRPVLKIREKCAEDR